MEQIRTRVPVAPLEVHPVPERFEPTLWVERVVLLRGPRIAEETIVREVQLRKGLNILWARAAHEDGSDADAQDRATGHSAGKTTFCRLIRYLLGETRFGTRWLQDRIRERLPDGWVVGLVRVKGEPWVISRAFSRGEHRFASRTESLAGGLEARESYQPFLEALEAAVTAPLRVQALPRAAARIDWPHVLPWLARDQEARFADIAEWRAQASESESPNPQVADRHVMARAMLDMISKEEVKIEVRIEESTRKRDQQSTECALQKTRAGVGWEQLVARLGREQAVSEGPLFATLVRTDVEQKRTALADKGVKHDAARKNVDKAADEWEEARGVVEARLTSLAGLKGSLKGERKRVEQAAAKALLTDLVAPPGRCNRLLVDARAQGCPLAEPAPVPMTLRAGERDREADAEHDRKDLAALEQAVAEAEHALAVARHDASEKKRAYFVLNTAFTEAEGILKQEWGAFEALEEQYTWAEQAAEQAARGDRELSKVARSLLKDQQRRGAHRKAHKDMHVRLTARFEAIVRELLGPKFSGKIDIGEGRLEPHISRRGELKGAAMATVGVLAFDLAALTLGLEGHGFFPSFLIHDGPREADLDLPIYETLFQLVAKLEGVFLGEPGFQYIVTTTTAPPDKLARAPWVLEPTLDASSAEGTLFKEDL